MKLRGRGCLFEKGHLFAILAKRVGSYLGKGTVSQKGTVSEKWCLFEEMLHTHNPKRKV